MTSSLNHPFDSNSSDAEAHTSWLRMQISQRLADNKQAIPQDQVMARMDALLDKLTKKTP